MAFIIQMQRRAIEALEPEAAQSFWPENMFKEPEGKFRHKEIYYGPVSDYPNQWTLAFELLGISIGVGTCSDIHGMDVAVFGYHQYGRSSRKSLGFEEAFTGLPKCTYAVLLWPHGVVLLGVNESGVTKLDPVLHNPVHTEQVVELIKFHEFSVYESDDNPKGREFSMHLYFKRTGLISTYKPIG